MNFSEQLKAELGCFIKTAEFGLLLVSDLDDLKLHYLAEEERKSR